ncbi:MAG: hypothetical protein NTV01_14305, partial [Bacteroidia bacterium]|nr:hypothetical protein [Bacteroidia bacterium]
MKNLNQPIALLMLALAIASCSTKNDVQVTGQHPDKSFIQDYSIKYTVADQSIKLNTVVSERNGYIQLFSSKGLLRPRDGQFLFPGTLVADVQDKQTSDKKIAG